MNSFSNRPIWRPYTQERTSPAPLEIVSAKGAYLYAKSGQRIFDGISSWWLITHGHCQPEIVAAVRAQAGKLDQVTFANFSHEPAEELAELLIKITPPELTRVFFTDNGSTAVEAALKMALQACAQNGKPQKRKFLAFAGAYHGDTVGAMSVSAPSAFSDPYKTTLFEILRAAHPNAAHVTLNDDTCDFERQIIHHHETLAAVIIEPLVQGAGGMIMWPDAAVKRVAELCNEYGVYLIFDEVMTGFGRTGKIFAMERLGITPDLVCLSKGLTGGTLPLAVTLVKEDIYRAFLSDEKKKMFFHGHSFTGNPISCAAAVANLKLFLTTDVREKIQVIEQAQREALGQLTDSSFVSASRACGTIAAIDLKCSEQGYLARFSERLAKRALDQGLFIRPLGSTIYLMPPYCAERAAIEEAWATIAESLED